MRADAARRVAAAGLLMLVAAVVPGPARGSISVGLSIGDVAREPAKGRLLVAARKLGGGGFARSVVLLVEHGPGGSMGLIVNRPSRMKLAQVLPSREDVKERGDELWVGGPVEPTRLMLLARAPEGLLDGHRVFDGVQLIATQRGLGRALGIGIPPAALRVYAGYAGWGAGQLDAEIGRGDWHVVDAEVGAVFSGEPKELWAELIDQASGRWVEKAGTQAPT